MSYFLLLILGLSTSALSPAEAQVVDPDLIRQFEDLRGIDRQTRTRSPLDESRERGTRDDPRLIEQRTHTDQEEEYSALELDYQRRANALLTQYGYDLFEGTHGREDAITGRVSDNYVLGVGDEVIVTFHGSSAGSQRVTVDREGRLLIEDLPPVEAAGRRFAEVRDEIRERTQSALIGTEAFVSVGALKMVSVYVVGEVNAPGVHRLTGLSTVLDALNRAGGVKKTGSLRQIRLHSGDGVRDVDLYDLLAGSGAADVTVRDGDRIVVPTIGPTAAVTGTVVRPGIYELLDRTSTASLLSLAGGSIRPSGYGLLINTLNDRGQQEAREVESRSREIAAGDILSVYNRGGGSAGVIEVAGHVRDAGTRSLDRYDSLRDLLPDVSPLKDYPYLLFGVVETTDPATFSKILKPFSPMKVLFGAEDVRLSDRDKVIFFGRDDIEFLSSNLTRQVVLTGEYEPKGEDAGRGQPMEGEEPEVCKPLAELARIVRDTRSERFAAAVRAVFVQVDSSEEKAQDPIAERTFAKIEQRQDQGLAYQRGPVQSEPERTSRVPQEKEEDELAHLHERDNADCPRVYEAARNLLPFVLEYVTSAHGSVRQPGVYPIAEGTAVSALAAVAGGTTTNVDLTNVELLTLRKEPEAGTLNFERSYVDATVTALSEVKINPGSSVRFNAVFVEQEPGGVLLDGEFRRPGVYTIRRGEKLSELIRRAGGLTDQAYPYGAVFTRERVKEAQKAGFKRAERELNLGLATAALKQRELSADVLLAAQQLAEKIATTEAVGRVVIEADPRVLEARPALDTVLEPGDQVFIPKRPNYVLMLGDILNPGAVQFTPGKNVEAYLREAGGIQKTADDDRIFVVLPNGVAKPVRMSSWGGSSDVMVPPGTSIIVPKDVEPIDTLTLVRDLTSIFGQIAVSAASIAVISR